MQASKEYHRQWRAANKDRVKVAQQRWYQENKEHARAIHRAYWTPEKRRAATLKKYGLSIAQWDDMFEAQGRACAICKSVDPGCSNGWKTDHCHNTGRVRGILCGHCNKILMRHITPKILRAAAAYLEPGGPLCSGF